MSKLSDSLTPDLIRLQVAVLDWEGAVRAAGELLVNSGKCTPAYVEAMISAVRELGPYMVIAPGLALAHARPEAGMLVVGLSLVTLSTPINFGSEVNDPVSLVVAFGGVDHTQHIELLADLASYLEDDERRAALTAALSVERVRELLREF